MEKVQKRATRLVHDLCNHAYENRLVELNLPSLKYQKHWGAMIMIYQLLHHKLNVNPSDLLTLNTSFITRGHNLKLYKPRTLLRVRSSFFAVRAINNWNSLSPTVINAPSVNVFKIFLDCNWTTFTHDYQVTNNHEPR